MDNLNIRNLRQKEAVEAFCLHRKSVINACPRFGKIKVVYDICNKLNLFNILIVVPRNEIANSWKQDKIEWSFEGNINFVTTKSIANINTEYDLIVFDEINEYSISQLIEAEKIMKLSSNICGLSGTITKKTRDEIEKILGLSISYSYTIEQGVKEGILADYEIIVHITKLNATEQKKYNSTNYLLNKARNENKPSYFFDLKIISLLQGSLSKLEKTKQLIQQNIEERLLVFSGLTEIADSMDIPSYHSKGKEKELLESFCKGDIPHLSTVNLVQSGITIKPINKCIVNYTSGNPEMTAQKICRVLGIEYSNPSKKADIRIICSDTQFEKNRLKSALSFFEESKIKYTNE